MSKPLLLSLGNGKVQEFVGGTNDYVPVWNASLEEWQAAPSPGGGGGGSGTVTSVGLTGGTSGLVIGGTTSPITTSGTYNLNAPQRFQFDTSADFAPTAVGQLSWNEAEGSLNTLMVGGNVDAVVGQQLYQRAVNGDTVPLTKGMVVYVFGSSGTRVQVKRAVANADLTSATILGVVAETIAVSGEGFIITSGKLNALSVLPSTTFADGDVVYLSPTTPGGLTPTKPTAPQHLVMVGYCVKASNGAAGVLVVHPQNGYELSEMHDVLITSPTSGQILVYDATVGQTRWENATPTGSNGVTVTPGAGSLAFSLDSSYAPTFLGLALSGLSASQFVKTDASKNLVSQATVSLTTEVSGTLPVGNGGTGIASPTAGRLLVGAGGSAMTQLAGSSTNDVVKWSGTAWVAGAVPAVTSVSLNTGTTGLTVGGVTNVQITSTGSFNIGGTLSAANGGTGTDLSDSTGIVAVSGGAFSAREITNGDISASAEIGRGKLKSENAYRVVANGSTGHLSEVASAGTAGQYLSSGGSGALPTWASIPYDLSGDAYGSLTSGQTIFRFIAPRNITLSAITAAGGASVKVQVSDLDVTLPGTVNVTTGQKVSVLTTSTGTDAYFTITAVVA
jgi:hypothetical protein